MSEVFRGTPAIVSVTISDQELRAQSYHVAGHDMSDVAEAVRAALAGLKSNDDESTIKTKKARKARRTKAEMTAQSVIDAVPQPPTKKEKAGAWLA